MLLVELIHNNKQNSAPNEKKRTCINRFSFKWIKYIKSTKKVVHSTEN